MSNKRIIEYDAASEARTDDNLLMDSPAVGTRKITATNLIKPAMDAVSNEETERQNGDTNLDGKKYGDFVSTTDVTIDGVTYKTFWVIAPTSSNQVYGIANHPTNGKLYKIYNNNGTFTAEPYDLNATKGDEISTKDGQTGTVQTGVVSTVAADTSLDNAIGTLLNNDVTQNKQISDIKSDFTELTDITKWNHESVSVAPSSLDTWVDGTVNGLSDAKRCIVTVYESSASNATKVGAYEFINVIGYGLITLVFTYNDTNVNNIYKSSTHVRVDFDNNKVGVRMVAKGTSATYRCIKDVYWI